MGLKDRLFYYLTIGKMPYQVKPGQTSPYTDPVCGMKVDPRSPIQLDYESVHYLFCAQSCVDRFRANPNRFIKRRAA